MPRTPLSIAFQSVQAEQRFRAWANEHGMSMLQAGAYLIGRGLDAQSIDLAADEIRLAVADLREEVREIQEADLSRLRLPDGSDKLLQDRGLIGLLSACTAALVHQVAPKGRLVPADLETISIPDIVSLVLMCSEAVLAEKIPDPKDRMKRYQQYRHWVDVHKSEFADAPTPSNPAKEAA